MEEIPGSDGTVGTWKTEGLLKKIKLKRKRNDSKIQRLDTEDEMIFYKMTEFVGGDGGLL